MSRRCRWARSPKPRLQRALTVWKRLKLLSRTRSQPNWLISPPASTLLFRTHLGGRDHQSSGTWRLCARRKICCWCWVILRWHRDWWRKRRRKQAWRVWVLDAEAHVGFSCTGRNPPRVFLCFVQVTETLPHPLDANYEMLNCKLNLMDQKKDPDFKVNILDWLLLENFFENNGMFSGSWKCSSATCIELIVLNTVHTADFLTNG